MPTHSTTTSMGHPCQNAAQVVEFFEHTTSRQETVTPPHIYLFEVIPLAINESIAQFATRILEYRHALTTFDFAKHIVSQEDDSDDSDVVRLFDARIVNP